MKTVLFSETQKFTQWWVILIFVLLNSIWVYAIVLQLIFDVPYGNNPISDTGIVILGLVLTFFSVTFFSLKLQTKITTDGIYFRFFPIHQSYEFISFNSIQKCYIRQYKPLKEFGGWGIRFGINSNAYNISGKIGLQLELKNGEKLLIGTQKPGKIENLLDSLGIIEKGSQLFI
jgi:hypothetical protein